AAAVMSQGRADAVVSEALFFGEDTTESSDPVDIFQRPINHATAAASILKPRHHGRIGTAIHGEFSEVSHIGKIASKFAHLVPLHEKDEYLKNWILNLVVLDKPEGSDTVLVWLALVKLSIAFDRTYTGSKAYIPQQDASVIVEVYQINAAVLTQNAEGMANIVPIVRVQPMIALLASPESNVDHPFAFGSQQRVLSC
ncbi:hypothetical protein BGZ74_004805, partial [Mortierella antarctica]